MKTKKIKLGWGTYLTNKVYKSILMLMIKYQIIKEKILAVINNTNNTISKNRKYQVISPRR